MWLTLDISIPWPRMSLPIAPIAIISVIYFINNLFNTNVRRLEEPWDLLALLIDGGVGRTVGTTSKRNFLIEFKLFLILYSKVILLDIIWFILFLISAMHDLRQHFTLPGQIFCHILNLEKELLNIYVTYKCECQSDFF